MDSLRKFASFFVFVFFALSLCIPSGYSWGSGALALLAIVTWKTWRKQLSLTGGAAYLVAIFLLMTFIWGVSFDTENWWSHNDYSLKYLLATLALCGAVGLGVAGMYAVWGVAVGAAGAAAIAAYQVLYLHLDRANGFTNAIQFGGIALFLGFASFVIAIFFHREWRWWKTAVVTLCGILGLIASLLSETRGAWLAIPLIFLLMAWVLYRLHGSKVLLKEGGAVLALVIAVIAFGHEKIESRALQAVQETQAYFAHGVADTSVGQRWDHWKLAWEMGLDSPWTGWGNRGYQIEKQKRVERGDAAVTTGRYGHAHNEILDMFARQGLVGLLALLAFYAVPFWVFFRQMRWNSRQASLQNCLASLGMMLPICYVAFGFTQVFFSHNSGHLFYIFAIVSFYAASRKVS